MQTVYLGLLGLTCICMPITALKTNSNSKSLTRYSKNDNLFYYVPLEQSIERLPRSEYHSRFSAVLDMTKAEVWNTYHRSDSKRIAGQTKKYFTFLGNQAHFKARMYPKVGNFFNPFHFASYQQSVAPLTKTQHKMANATIYNLLLNRQKKQAAHVVAALKQDLPNLSINSDNNYTCVLLSLDKPTAEKNVKTWTSFVGVYYLAIVNKLAMERGINIEAHLRSSFNTLRPSIAECGKSLRISFGLVPDEYLNCVIDGIKLVQRILGSVEDKTQGERFKVTLDIKRLKNDLEKYSKDRTKKIKLKDTLWDTLWAAGDSKGCSFASQIFRKPHTTEYLIDLILNNFLDKSLEDLFNDEQALQKAITDPLIKLFKLYKLSNGHLTFDVKSKTLKSYDWQNETKIEDKTFWDAVKILSQKWRIKKTDLNNILKAQKASHLHSMLEHLGCQFTFSPNSYQNVTDGNGSDSDEEAELAISKKKSVPVHARKLITATGMRAIQLSYAVGRQYLEEQGADILNVGFNADRMYYETDDAIANHPIPLDSIKNNTAYAHIGFFDLNHCNSLQDLDDDDEDVLFANVHDKDRIAIVDTTSATTDEMKQVLKKLYKQRPKLEAIICLSSGLKNEQGMMDYNPYGTIRIFAKTKQIKENLYDKLVELEEEADYHHPKHSHMIRKTAKDSGMTPTNRSILK